MPGEQRKLAAILAADVVGYSRLMAADEAGTLAALKARRKAVLEPLVARYQGRVFKIAGDGALIEFSSPVNAVHCAIELQRAFASVNDDLPEDGRIVLRIGVHVGDVMVEGSDLYGDGINIAARLEALAEPGGILVSAPARDHIGKRMSAEFEDVGPQALKNIDEPVRAYRVTGLGQAAPAAKPAQAERPTIAVLPFVNMSGDIEQEYFSDGITEDIITELSRFHSLVVVSRNSSFAFKGRSVNVRSVSRQLGARYLVEGSVRRVGDQFRITAQLIDAAEDAHLWAERYDRRVADIFEVQDQVVRAIVLAIEPKLLSVERRRALRQPPESLGAWENYQRGSWHLLKYQAGETRIAISFFERAIALDPGFAPPYAGLAWALYLLILLDASTDRDADLERARRACDKAIELDEDDPLVFAVLCRVHILRRDSPNALRAAERAVALNPQSAMAHFGRGHALWHAGRPSEAVGPLDEALRLSPLDPMRWVYDASKAIALALSGEPDGAIECSRRAQAQPNAAIFANIGEICALGLTRRMDEAPAAVARAKAVMPSVSISFVDRVLSISEPATRAKFLEGLRIAGMPE